MNNNDLDFLLKTMNGYSDSNERKSVLSSQQYIKKICKSLTVDSAQYDYSKTIETIKKYINLPDGLGRVMYSQISNYVYGLDESERGIFASNIDRLLTCVQRENVDDDCKKIVIKLYDHFQLSVCQIENAKNIFTQGIGETKDDLMKEIKRVEKEHVAIFGIFASIVLAFVGGITFSTSVLQNIHQSSIYRLIMISLIIGFIFMNLLFVLFYYIDRIVKIKNESKIKPQIIANVIVLGLIIVTFVGWLCGIVEWRNDKFKKNTHYTQYFVAFYITTKDLSSEII